MDGYGKYFFIVFLYINRYFFLIYMSVDKFFFDFYFDYVLNLNELFRKVVYNNICIMSDRMIKVVVWKLSVKII